jgi:hypothetical protein
MTVLSKTVPEPSGIAFSAAIIRASREAYQPLMREMVS